MPPTSNTAFTPLAADVLLDLQRQINSWFSATVGQTGYDSEGRSGLVTAPLIDVTEDDKTLWVSVEVPGVTAADLEVYIHQSSLYIRGEKKQH